MGKFVINIWRYFESVKVIERNVMLQYVSFVKKMNPIKSKFMKYTEMYR